jgi:hypothetical protein
MKVFNRFYQIIILSCYNHNTHIESYSIILSYNNVNINILYYYKLNF